MIRVAVNPGTLIAGQPAGLTFELSNAGEGACSDIAFRLKLPPGMALVSGRERIDLDQIPARHVHVHQVTVLPGAPGDVAVGTSNFSYRDENGVPRRGDDWQASIRVLPADAALDGLAPAGPTRPLPRLAVRHHAGKLTLGEWESLEVVLHNTTGCPLFDVTVTIDGPFRIHPSSAQFQLLRVGDTDRAAFNIHVPDRGKVPVRVHTTYRRRDERGQVISGEQEDRLTVEVAARAEMARTPDNQGQASPAAPVTTILYLVAQPKNTPLLATYQEMREVETELLLGRDRESFRMEHRVAVRTRDISRALGYYRPQIVNFAGHGREDGSLAVEDENGFATFVDPDGLANLLGGFASTVQCVVVNFCHSLALAEAVSKKIDYVVGMRSEILDSASVQFSVGFYQGLFAGKSVPDAFEQGRNLVQMVPRFDSEYMVPTLLTRWDQ